MVGVEQKTLEGGELAVVAEVGNARVDDFGWASLESVHRNRERSEVGIVVALPVKIKVKVKEFYSNNLA